MGYFYTYLGIYFLALINNIVDHTNLNLFIEDITNAHKLFIPRTTLEKKLVILENKILWTTQKKTKISIKVDQKKYIIDVIFKNRDCKV